MKGHGRYSVNTLHIPCSPPLLSQIPYLQNTNISWDVAKYDTRK